MPNNFLPGASKRMEVLPVGVFSIAATLLVLEIKVPHFEQNYSNAELWEALKNIAFICRLCIQLPEHTDLLG
ncbi:MAG: DUF1211 domain-containing protein [Sphingobacteriales bacterium]|nr:MAG: DUF1211 domain-containing protein [Sphingobacteriales bacterium]